MEETFSLVIVNEKSNTYWTNNSEQMLTFRRKCG